MATENQDDVMADMLLIADLLGRLSRANVPDEDIVALVGAAKGGGDMEAVMRRIRGILRIKDAGGEVGRS